MVLEGAGAATAADAKRATDVRERSCMMAGCPAANAKNYSRKNEGIEAAVPRIPRMQTPRLAQQVKRK